MLDLAIRSTCRGHIYGRRAFQQALVRQNRLGSFREIAWFAPLTHFCSPLEAAMLNLEGRLLLLILSFSA